MRNYTCTAFLSSIGKIGLFIASVAWMLSTSSCMNSSGLVKVDDGATIALVGNNLCSRMMNYGHFETDLYSTFPGKNLVVRNMCDGGDTPGFRPHSGRESPWAFPGAQAFYTDLARVSGSEGHLESPDEWLDRLNTDIILGFFGYNAAQNGMVGIDNYKAELTAFINHIKSQKYNGVSAPQLVLVSPIAREDITATIDVPDGKDNNELLAAYTKAMGEVAASEGIPFVDVYTPSLDWMAGPDDMTVDGFQLNDEGYRMFSSYVVEKIFGGSNSTKNKELIKEAVLEKNWTWHNDFKIPNGVHVFGRRFDPYGPDNYPYELEKIRQMTAIRDSAIWMAAIGKKIDLAAADATTRELPPVETNYAGDTGSEDQRYIYGNNALSTLKTPSGYKIELFASEEEFEDLANPVQLSFDNAGRLWVAVMPTYPHYKPGDDKPDDKLIILEDTDGDGKADKQTTFADGLHIPVGFEFAPEGVYVSQGTNLILLTDTDGDDKVDKQEIIYSGFDDHDTHHVISAFCADPSGAIYMGEGVFLHTNVETPYGTVRGTHGGFYRFSPQKRQLEKTSQIMIPNPWGIAFDDWGQVFFAETSGPDMRWLMPSTMKPRYSLFAPKSPSLIEESHRVRPTSGLEFVSSRHFPDNVQGDLLINNTIGFLGMKQHTIKDDGTGYRSRHVTDLVKGSDTNFRPVDMEFAPDGSLYMIDWHNVLIGHMQHNARDPLRDHVHGRIYRITYPSRPLVEPAEIDGAPITTLLDNLKLHEYRTRYRTRRELRERNVDEVAAATNQWVKSLDKNDPMYAHHLLEGLWVTWGINKLDREILEMAMSSDNYKTRAATAHVIRYMGHQLEDQTELLATLAGDEHGRVRLGAIVAASWLEAEQAKQVLMVAEKMPMDDWIEPFYKEAYNIAYDIVPSNNDEEDPNAMVNASSLEGDELKSFMAGAGIYGRDGHCGTCHQSDGEGLAESGFPPLAGTDWVTGDPERLIKITLHGLYGPIEVLGKKYPGQVPMTAFGNMLDDQEIADVLTFVRNSFGNEASVITPEQVAKVREETKDKKGFYKPADLAVVN